MAESAFAKFKSQAAASAGAPAQAPIARPPAQRTAAPARAAVSKYSGVKAAAGKDPMPQPGEYLFKILKTFETSNPRTGEWFHASLEVVESNQPMNPAGSVCSFLQGVSGKSLAAGGPRVKAFAMAAAGFDDEAAYDEMDPDGQFLDACAGVQGRTYPDGSPIVENPLGARYVLARVTRGKDDGKGDFYREFSWSPVAEEDQASAAAQ